MPKAPEPINDLLNKRNPAISPAVQENRMISLAVDLAEQQLREGTATTPVITHYLKLATEREKLEREKLQRENELLSAKVHSIENAKRAEEIAEEAIMAMRSYHGED